MLIGHGAQVLGREVYTSNLQLGGPDIMYRNGVSHLTVANDFDGVKMLLHWLSYVPVTTTALPPTLAYTVDERNHVFELDPLDRDVAYAPPSYVLRAVGGA